jgi:DUF1009 family protein
MGAALGLVGGAGALPTLVAREARRQGWRVVLLALGEAIADAEADRIVPCRLGDVGPILGVLAEEGIRDVVLAGRVSKASLFHGGTLDDSARSLLGRAADWSDDALLRTAAGALAGMGIELLDQRRFLGPWLAPAGPVAGPAVPAAQAGDVARGIALAREMARHGVGQTVVLRAGSVAAVEAMEGTDEAIRRGLGLAGRGAVVAKATAPGHDYRFDVPTVGPGTLACCAAGGAGVLAVEAGRVLLLERERLHADAGRAGISVVGVADGPGGD